MITLFITHFIADFILQSRAMGKNKSSNIKYLLSHISIIFLCFLCVASFKFAAYNALIHLVIDATIWNGFKLFKFIDWYSISMSFDFNKKIAAERVKDYQYWEDHWFYVFIGLDQLLHAITIVYLFEMGV